MKMNKSLEDKGIDIFSYLFMIHIFHILRHSFYPYYFKLNFRRKISTNYRFCAYSKSNIFVCL